MDAVTTEAWMGLVSQRSRLLRLDTPLPEDALQAERLRGREGVCEGFRFELDCLSASARLDLRALLGREATVSLARPQAGPVRWHGMVMHARRLGSDGGLARYRLVLQPWLALLAHRRNALVFQDCDARGVLERVFADYPQASVRFDLSVPLPLRPVRTQFRETDLEFVLRVLAEEGLAWYVEHDADADAGEGGGEQARHRLVVFDARAELEDGHPAHARFHRTAATEASDAITVFSRRLSTVPASASLASWDFRQLAEVAGVAGEAAEASRGLDMFEASRPRHFRDGEQAAASAEARLAALQLPGEIHWGEGSVRGMAAGRGFTLLQHDSWGGQRFRPLVVEHEAANNLGAGIASLLDAPDVERGTYRNRFACVPAAVAPLPRPRARPSAPGPQTARVVGAPGASVGSNRDHQVRIQFPWQRGRAPVRGGLDDAASTAHPEGHAPGDDRSGTWVRVAEALAGPNWGTHFLPRVGSEVLVEFEHGDIDRPVIVGQLYNGEDRPPLAGGEGSEANHIGVLSGVWTQGLDGRHPQSWVVDDSSGQLRQRIETSLAQSRLELGHLVEQPGPRRGACVGSGFELRSAAWGRVHADGGMLVSTTARAAAGSVQMETRQVLGQVRAAQRTTTNVADASVARGAPASAAGEAIDALLEHLDPEAGAAFEGPVGGQPSTRPAPGTRQPQAPTERFTQAQLLLEAPADVAMASTGAMTLAAGDHLSLTVQEDLHLSAGHTIAMASAESAALSAHEGELRIIAAKGPVSLEAHTDELELLADESLTLTSTDDGIEILASDSIELRVGNSAIRLEGGDVAIACTGRFVAKGAVHPFAGGGQVSPELKWLPAGYTTPSENPESEVSHSDSPDCVEGWRLDSAFLETSEGALVLNGYVPTKSGEVIGQSGVTISTGVDLGQQNRAGTLRVLNQYVNARGPVEGASVDSLVTLLEPYFTLKRQDAVAKLAQAPISISMPEAELLANAFKYDFQLGIDRQFNRRNQLGMKFRNLPMEAQTVIVDFAYQYGLSDTRGPIRETFWGHVYEGRWQSLAEWLMGAPDAYRSRRVREGQLLQSAIDQKHLPEVGDPCAGILA